MVGLHGEWNGRNDVGEIRVRHAGLEGGELLRGNTSREAQGRTLHGVVGLVGFRHAYVPRHKRGSWGLLRLLG